MCKKRGIFLLLFFSLNISLNISLNFSFSYFLFAPTKKKIYVELLDVIQIRKNIYTYIYV